ncbi:MAG TPA: Xaa-Pro dipeptidase [Woeseiaceae bacterium]|nr:Xaa-Pro dipeptidase [Woeseiaceae bacterium]
MNTDYTDQNMSLRSLYAEHIASMCARFDEVLEMSGAAHAVIFSGALHYAFLDDHSYPFRPNPHFLAWAPLEKLPLSYIAYTPGERPLLVYHQPRDYWHSVPGEPSGFWPALFDIRIVHTLADTARHLPGARDKCILLGEISDSSMAFGIERINPPTALNFLHLARGRKTEYELACMRLASERAVAGHRAAETAFGNGASEFAIHQAYCKAVSQTDNELPYGNIIALNEHSAILHYTQLDRTAPSAVRSFLIDAGAQVFGYASDITRTYDNGDNEFRALIQRMDAMQQDIVSRVRTGLDYRELHLETHRLLAELLVDAELATGDAETLLATGVTSAFFPHGLGHLLGLQVHDVAGHMQDVSGTIIDPPSGHPHLRLTRVLEENMVVTIEPGLYFIDMLLENLRGSPAEAHVNWQTVAAFRPFGGIRIEDDVRVLADGTENLTRNAFAL